MKTSWLICCVLLLAIAAAAQGNFVYTDDNNSPNTVSAFTVAADGSLTLIPGSPFSTGGNGGGSDVDPQQIRPSPSDPTASSMPRMMAMEPSADFRLMPRRERWLRSRNFRFRQAIPEIFH
jgi:hypothetical protein